MTRYTQAVTVLALAIVSAQGADRWWDGGAASIGSNGDGTSQGGAGTWNTTIQNWDQGNGLAHVAWVNASNDIAIFSGTAGTVTFGGAVTVGGLQFDTAGYTLSGNQILTFGTSGNIAVNANAGLSWNKMQGDATAAINKTGAGTLTLYNNQAYTFLGQLTVAQGTLSVNRLDLLGSSATLPVVLGSSGQTGTLQYTDVTTSSTKKFTLAAGGTGVFDVSTAATTLTLSGVIDGSGNLTKTNAGTLALSAATGNTYSGITTVSAGVLQLSSASALPGGIGTSGGTSALTLTGGVVGLGNGNFSRGLGTGVDQVQFTVSGGFAAFAADRLVNLGGTSAGVTWNSGSFVPTGSALILGAGTATHTVDFQNPIDLNGATRSLQVDNGTGAVDGKLSGDITGTGGGGILKTGAGTVLLSGNNNYSGSTTVSAGTLVATKAASLPGYNSSGLVVFNGGTIGVQVSGSGWASAEVDALLSNATKTSGTLGIDTSNGDFTQGAAFTPATFGPLGLNKLGSNTLILDEANTYTGPTTVSAGTLQLTHTGAIGSSSSMTLASGTTLALRSDTSATFTTPANAVGVSTVIEGGTGSIDVNNNGGGSGSTLTMSGGIRIVSATVNSTTTINVTGGSNGYTLNIPTLTWQNNSTQYLSLVPTTASMTVSNLVFVFTGGQTQRLYLDGTSTGNVLGSISSSSWLSVTKQGTGTWSWNHNASSAKNSTILINGGNLIVNGTLASQSSLTLQSGTLHYNNSGAVDTSSKTLTITGGNLDNTSGAPITTSTTNPTMAWNGNFTFLGSNGTNSDLNIGTGAVTMGATRIVTVNSNATLTVGGTISGAGFGLTKAGTGTLKLGGNSTYTGATLVTNGTLLVNGSLGTNTVSVTNNATLGGTGTVNGSVFVWANCTNAPGDSIGVFNVASNMTISGTLAIEIDDTQTPKCDTVAVSRNLNISGATLKITANGTLGQSAYVIATYGSLTGAFAATNGLPTGCTLDYAYSGNQIAILRPLEQGSVFRFR